MNKSSILMLVLTLILIACAPAITPNPTSTPSPSSRAESRDLTPPTPVNTSAPTPLAPIPHLDIFFADQSVKRALNLASAFHSVYIHEIGSPDYITFHENTSLHGASTIKMAIAVVVAQVTQQNGINIWSTTPQGQTDTVAVLLQKMLVLHEDQATSILIDYINSLGYSFDKELSQLGIDGFDIYHRLTTARSLGLLYENLATNSWKLNENEYLLDLLSQNSGKDKGELNWTINDKLPGSYDNLVGAIYDAEISILNLGTIRYVAADSGIWTTPDGHQFVIVLLGNYDSERGFHTENSFIHKIADILSDL